MRSFSFYTLELPLLILLPLFLFVASAFGQSIALSPAAPAVNAGGSLTFAADRPVKFSLFGYGSITSVTATSAVYTAPASGLYPQHLLNGCMVGPNDSVFNMRIDSLPVDANSASWTPFILSNGAVLGYKWGVNVVNNSTPMAAQQFLSTTQMNGSLFPAPPQTSLKRQNGSYTTDSDVDHHVLSLNTQTCQFYETNQQGIAFNQCPTCTADSGWSYASTSYALPSGGVGGGSADPSGLPLAALTLHVSEIRAGHISHALRFTACAACVSGGVRWPATSSTGTQSGAPPAGTRFRLKSSFSTANFPTAARRILVALQQYGMILAGPGPDGEISVSTDVTADAGTVLALQSLAGGALNYSNFEVVDESKYMLSPASSAVNPWNGFSFPVSFALLTVTDAANSKNVQSVPIALQPAMAGIAEPTITVQAGTPAFQIPNWVTGSTNQAINWTISPASGGGAISASGVYTPPASVNNPLNVGLTLTSAVNTIPFATAGVSLTVIPTGAIRIDSGSAVSTIDDRGLTWLSDLGFETGNSTVVSAATPQNAWSTTYNHTAWQTYQNTAGDDILYEFRVANGTYAVQLMFGVGDCVGSFAGQSPGNAGLLWGPLNLQSQTGIAYSNWNFGTPIKYKCQTPETASMVAQVTDNTLTVAVRATGGNGQHTVPLLNGLTITPISPLAATNPVFSQNSTPGITPTFNIKDIDPSCGLPNYNCRAAFQNAFGMLAGTGGGTLYIPCGKFLVDFPELAQNVASAPWFSAASLIAVPPNTKIQGHLAAYNVPDSVIQWRNTSVPNFVFAKASNSSMQNLYVLFMGSVPALFPYGDVVLLRALGYNTSYPHLNQMSGGSHEMFTFAMVFDSDYTYFNNLIFNSATADNNHLSGSAINLKGKGVLVNGDGGLTALAVGNKINKLQIFNFLSGITVAGQNGVRITNVGADWRGSSDMPAPGHLLYSTSTNHADPSGKILSVLQSTNVTIQNMTEGPHTFSNTNSGGTLAIKYINGGLIDNINSQHPVGLIQTLYADQNITFSNMTWKSSFDLCASLPTTCGGPIIYSTMDNSQAFTIQNLTFKNISLTSTVTPISVLLMGDGLIVDGMNIQTPPTFVPNQVAKSAVLGLKLTTKALVKNFTYTPLITTYNPYGNYNNPLIGWRPSSNVTAQVTIKWPAAIAVPAGAAIISSGTQDVDSNSSVTTTIVQQ